jgi:crotonobetainyl-CoA:carnitine CoA-transferase CaiB-like acyl-CoA transferase
MTHWYAYRTRDGRYLSISPVMTGQIADLREIIGDPALSDAKFETLADRKRNAAEFYDIVSRWVAARDFDEVWAVLRASSVPAGPVNSVPDLLEDPHIAARGSLVTSKTWEGRPIVMPASTPRIGEAPQGPRWTGEPLGASNALVYTQIIGLSDAEIADLRTRGVI